MNKNTTFYDEILDFEMQPKQSTIEFLQTFSRIVYAKKFDSGMCFSMVLN